MRRKRPYCPRKNSFSNIRLVLMDIQMPEMDGLTATQEIRQTLQLPDLPIIAMTAHAMKGDIEKSLAAGMNLHLTKPIDPELLYKTLSQYLIKPKSALQKKPDNRVKSSETKAILTKLRLETILAVDEAVKKIQGKEDLYTEIIHDFWLNYQVQSQAMVQCYKLAQMDILYRSAHSLKSAAQYIGAFELATCANALENEIHHQGLHIELKLNKVIKHLDFIISQLNPIYNHATLAKTDQAFDIKAAKKIIEKLKPCLISANIEAEDITKELMAIGHETLYHQYIDNILKLVNNFDFDEASAALSVLEQKISDVK